MRKAKNFWNGNFKVWRKNSPYIRVLLRQALAGIVEYDYNAGCCQAKRNWEVNGFLVAWCNGKKVKVAGAWATVYVNSCSSGFEDEENEEFLEAQIDEFVDLIRESKEPVLLHSHKGKILFV